MKQASTQYTDLKGSVAIDCSNDLANDNYILNFLLTKGYKFDLVSAEIASLKIEFSDVELEDSDSYINLEGVITEYSEENGEIQKPFSLEITPKEFFKLFERFSLEVSQSSVD